MSRKNCACWVSVAMAAFLLFSLSFCMRDGAPKTRSNVLPDGKYVCEAGTLTFWHGSPVAPSGDAGYVDVELTPEYIYLLDGRENNKQYDFKLDERHGYYDTWYMCADSGQDDNGDRQEIPFLNFTWDKRGWDTRKDTVTIQGADGGLVFRLNESK